MLEASGGRRSCGIVWQEVMRENGLGNDCVVSRAAPRAH